jgi:hypothetical protein
MLGKRCSTGDPLSRSGLPAAIRHSNGVVGSYRLFND